MAALTQYSPQKLNQAIKSYFEGNTRRDMRLSFRGKVTHYKSVFSGIQFMLTEDAANLQCYMPHYVKKYCDFSIQNGIDLQVKAVPIVWGLRARVQLYIDHSQYLRAGQQTANIKEFNKLAKTYAVNRMEKDFITRGIVSKYQFYPRGRFASFDLENEGYSIRCYVPAQVAKQQQLSKGLMVEVQGTLNFYERQGCFQLTTQSIHVLGQGQVSVAKEFIDQLEDKGLYPKVKRAIPTQIRQLGIVSNKSAQGYKDVVTILGRGGVAQEQLVLAPTKLQTKDAPQLIAKAIDSLNQNPAIDAILMTRGGGHKKDLSSFNTYPVIEAMCKAQKPIITAIGHASDHLQADEFADLACVSPSDAAHQLLPHLR